MQWLIDIIMETALKYLPKARCYLPDPQAIPTATFTKMLLYSESYDTHNQLDHARFTAARPGYYLVTVSAHITPLTPAKLFAVAIYKNTIPHAYQTAHTSSAFSIGSVTTDILYLQTGDYIEPWCYHDTGNTRYLIPGTAYSFMTVSQIF